MLNAEDAMNQTLKYIEFQHANELTRVFSKINIAIANGLFYIFEPMELHESTQNKLREMGYDVTADICDGCLYYFISWMACDIYKNIVK